MPRWSNW